MSAVKSLKFRNSSLASANEQLKILSRVNGSSFEGMLDKNGMHGLYSSVIEIMQVNIGKMCNQVCRHCHVDAGPDRKEIMTRETMELCLEKLAQTSIGTVDITGGAPELNPNFRWFVTEIKKLNRHIIDRCNLTIILSNPKFHDLPAFFAENGIEIVSSLPFYSQSNTDRQRGEGVFEKSIKALQMLSTSGYGMENSGLMLNLVYNPAGAFLPAGQQSLEKLFKDELKRKYDISFNNLYTITNMPISRFLEYLMDSGNYEEYMEKLVNAFNPVAARNVMCINTISIGWDGYLYDCDFNQMLDLKIKKQAHVKDFDINYLQQRRIITGSHCFGCTAGAGSSCGGTTV